MDTYAYLRDESGKPYTSSNPVPVGITDVELNAEGVIDVLTNYDQ